MRKWVVEHRWPLGGGLLLTVALGALSVYSASKRQRDEARVLDKPLCVGLIACMSGAEPPPETLAKDPRWPAMVDRFRSLSQRATSAEQLPNGMTVYPGQAIRTQQAFGVTGLYHAGIFIGSGQVVHVQPSWTGVRVVQTSLENFADGGKEEDVVVLERETEHREIALMISSLAKDSLWFYHFLDRNCESFTEYCHSTSIKSAQVGKAGWRLWAFRPLLSVLSGGAQVWNLAAFWTVLSSEDKK